MKKKIIAVFLTLCMVLGMLPLSALAASWLVEFGGTSITLTKNGGSITSEPDQSQYYTFKKVSDDQDNYQFYVFAKVDENTVLATLTGTPICDCTAKCKTGSIDSACLVCSADGAKIDECCKGASSDAKIYTITLDANGGELADGVTSVTTEEDGTLGGNMPGDPAYEGHLFRGWNTKQDGSGDTVTADHKFQEDATIYAQWEAVLELKAEATIGEDGVARSTVSVPEGADWVNETKAKPEKTIVIRAASPSGNAAAVEVKIGMDGMKQLAAIDKIVLIETDRGTVNLPAADVKKLAGLEGVETVILKIGEESDDVGSITKLKNATYYKVVDVSLTDEAEHPIAPKGGDLKLNITVSVKVDLTITDGKKAAVWYKPVKGALESQSGAEYDIGNKRISWTATHFSEYVFGVTTTSTSTSGNGGSGGGGGGSSSSGYTVSVNRTTNGSISVSPSRAEKGDTVTITVRPNSGYELDKLTVKDADGNTIRVTNAGDGKYTFTMPDSRVEIEATFKAIVTEDTTKLTTPSFSDVPSSFWAYDQIAWAAEKGIMSGYGNGIFGPDRNTTRQALWMVLGRLNGTDPADMTAARSWSMNSGVSDGTDPSGTMSRQQMVTMLYRYAQRKGYATTGSTDLSRYPDSGSVASYARDALSWAVANGIVTGTTDGRLAPTGTASRAHFAVFMYRFCNLYNIA